MGHVVQSWSARPWHARRNCDSLTASGCRRERRPTVIVRNSPFSGKSHVGYRLSFVGALSPEDDELFDWSAAMNQAALRHGGKPFEAAGYVFGSFAAAKSM